MLQALADEVALGRILGLHDRGLHQLILPDASVEAQVILAVDLFPGFARNLQGFLAGSTTPESQNPLSSSIQLSDWDAWRVEVSAALTQQMRFWDHAFWERILRTYERHAAPALQGVFADPTRRRQVAEGLETRTRAVLNDVLRARRGSQDQR